MAFFEADEVPETLGLKTFFHFVRNDFLHQNESKRKSFSDARGGKITVIKANWNVEFTRAHVLDLPSIHA